MCIRVRNEGERMHAKTRVIKGKEDRGSCSLTVVGGGGAKNNTPAGMRHVAGR